jgi:hypothetical protein
MIFSKINLQLLNMYKIKEKYFSGNQAKFFFNYKILFIN